MPANDSPVLSPEELKDSIAPGTVIVDARVGPAVRDSYREKHLAGARFADLDKDLADIGPDAAKGGRHPLPNIEAFGAVLGSLGITPASRVVVYDDKNGVNAAARFWWMLRAVGHQNVQVLDGGFQAALAAGVPVNGGDEIYQAADPYPVSAWKLMLADISEVDSLVSRDDHLVIDVRDAYRYNGESEPIDLVAGHIPGAVNIPFSENLDGNGRFRSAGDLKEKYTHALAGKTAEQVIVHCGSGVTACHTLLAMDHAGMEIPRLYVGSWSEWSRTGRPIGKK